ncbi:Oxygen-dependent coproporphyrinogen-III oxidase, mitochondrial [Colletotrichum chlorophyti]|uniref:coproporphyrinogen oxidase n=1 Tax=Colletotrichum chlorophyti TaxID=708187 RepID=A0A1Q8RYZ6_9PEZI|nr:Oxygen-dependent coproporphyrinogen-III oxidase, mitochondrial [Colletotrichum chlorophyti]
MNFPCQDTQEPTVGSTLPPIRLRMEDYIQQKQREIIAAIEKLDGKPFHTDGWERPEGGWGRTCVLQDGRVFEKAGVNISVVHGKLNEEAINSMRADHASLSKAVGVSDVSFHALGLSMIMHPKNPMAPSVHMNCRYFETHWVGGTAAWFGGGSDLSPAYLFDEDAVHFHQTLKEACDEHDAGFYPKFKRWCDTYFTNTHHNEGRGIGGIFFDDLDDDLERLFAFVRSATDTFLPAYLPIVHRRKDMPFSDKEKEWQQLRRGRYVEFNLVHDRGTAFGLSVPGSRVESILVSLPLTAQWRYMYEPEQGSAEQKLIDVLRNPKEWV